MTEKKLFGDPAEVTQEQLVAKIMHQKRVIDKLVRLAIALTSRTDIIEMLDVVCNESRELLGAENATIYLLEPEEKVLRFLSTSTKNLEDIMIPLDKNSIAGHTILAQEALKINDVRAIPPDAGYRFNDTFDRHHNYRTVSIMSVPMVEATGETLGALQVLNKRSGGRVVPFTEYDLEIARALASISAVTIEKTRLGIQASSRLDEVEEKKEAIASTQELLRHSERLSTIGQLAASIAHEVNSPVTGIINYANFVLSQRRVPRKTRADVEAIKEQAQRVSTIVKNLL
ncbi:MAG: GAF domain-containing protein, partial [bacterium]